MILEPSLMSHVYACRQLQPLTSKTPKLKSKLSHFKVHSNAKNVVDLFWRFLYRFLFGITTYNTIGLFSFCN